MGIPPDGGPARRHRDLSWRARRARHPQLRWHTRLAGRIERELARQPLDLESAVVDAWRATADDLAGRVSNTEIEPHGQRVDEELEDRARAGWSEPALGRRRGTPVGFVDRLKAALAA